MAAVPTEPGGQVTGSEEPGAQEARKVDRSVIDRLEDVWVSLVRLGDELAADDWDRATDCPDWTVKDVYAHVLGSERRLLGDDVPDGPDGRPPRDLHAANAAWVHAYAATPGPDVLAELRTVAPRRLAALREAPDERLVHSVETPLGTMSYLAYLGVRVVDAWTHEQDVRRAVDLTGHRRGPVPEFVVDAFVRTLPRVVARRAALPDGTTVGFAITSPVRRDLAVEVQGGRGLVGERDETDACLELSSETFCLLAAGRRDPADVLEDGSIRVVGDEDVAWSVLAYLKTVP